MERLAAAAGEARRRPHRIVRVLSVDIRLPDPFPTVTLEDSEGRRERLAFRIGTSEGVALAHALAGSAAPRPSTHDLFALALERFGVEILAVRLTGRVGATYLAELELSGPAGRQVLSCRPSDGICLALRQRVPAPVLCDEELFVAAGDVLPIATAGDPREIDEPATPS
ncbi:MAG: bifunctional nuclease family protein [Acidimicrobiales bacterium]